MPTTRPQPRHKRKVRLATELFFDVPLRPALVVKNLGSKLLLDFGEGFQRLLPAEMFKDVPIRKSDLKLVA